VFTSDSEASEAADKLVQEKLRKGYVEVSGAGF
jgi:predicted DNA-binding WGR domain protein